ncbi:MAG: DUF3710 domain-containing protein [Frankia sp.]
MLGWLRRSGVGRRGDATGDVHLGDATGDVHLGEVAQDADRDAPPAVNTSVPGRGPYDVDHVPNDHVRRIDVGSVLVPVLAGVDYRVCTAGNASRVTAVAAVAGASSMEITVHAAPKSSGLWDQVREQLYRSEPVAPGRAVVTEGRHGRQLVLPGADSHGQRPKRIVGIDGPRWMLRAVITGPAWAVSAETPTLLDDLLSYVVVLRGDRAMPVGAPLPLHLPTDNGASDGDGDDQPRPTDDPLGRVRPTGTGSADPRRVSYAVISAPVGGLSRNLTTWG